MTFPHTNSLLLSLCLSLTLISSHTYAREADTSLRSVGQARWHKERIVNPQQLLQQTIPADGVSIIFIREQDNDGLQSSANIAINDRYQVSLQSGNYTQVNSCAGINQLSAQITGHKNNDLLYNAVNYRLAPQQTYYFDIDVDEYTGAASIRNLSQEQALPRLNNKPYQHHQISRVVPNCVGIEPIQMELNILFDTDKSYVKPQYYPEIERVIDYLNRFPNVSVTLGGHTDNRASDNYNQALSQRRMEAVRKIFIERYGIAPQRVHAIGYGESQPIASNATAEGRQQNRRVVAVFHTVQP